MSNSLNYLKMFIGGLHPKTTEDDLYYLFSHLCETTCIEILKNRKNGKPLGYAFFFVNGEQAAKSLLNRNFYLHGRSIQCQRKEVSRHENKKRRLVVGGLPQGITNQKLKDCFSKFGKLRSAYIVREKNFGKEESCGFIDFLEK